MCKLELNKEYRVKHSRKGTFTGILKHFDDTWAVLLLTQGRANAMLAENIVDEGEEVTIRRSFCEFNELDSTLIGN